MLGWRSPRELLGKITKQNIKTLLNSTALGTTAFTRSQVRALRLIRMLKLERYVKAFAVYDDVMGGNLDILAVSGFFALVAWVFASTLL